MMPPHSPTIQSTEAGQLTGFFRVRDNGVIHPTGDTMHITTYHLALGSVTLAAAADNTPRSFAGVANSGQPFTYKGRRTVIDLAGISHKSDVPALIEHDRARRAGVGHLSVTARGLEISGTLLSNEHGKQVAADADEGFPWELSAHVVPGRVEQLAAGANATVNGHTVTGPLAILRANTIREVSFTPTGVDDATSAVILGDDGANPASPTNNTGNTMTLEEALAKIQELEAKISTLENEKSELQKANETLEGEKRAADVDAQLAAAGYLRSEDGKSWRGLSAATHAVLLAAKPEDAKAMIADLKLAHDAENGAWLAREQTPPAATTNPTDIQLANNPLLADADARRKDQDHYI